MGNEPGEAAGKAVGTSQAKAKRRVRYGAENWQYFYIVLALALAIEAFIVAALPLEWGWQGAIFLSAVALTTYLILFNAKVEEALLRCKGWYENQWR